MEERPTERSAARAADKPGNNAENIRETNAPSGWVTTQQAARALGVTPRTVRWHIEQGNIEAKPQGEGVRRAWLVSIDSLQTFRNTRQRKAPLPGDYRAPTESPDIAAEIPGNAIRELADRLVEEAAKAAEFRVRLELTERAESTLRAELEEERRRREGAEQEHDDLRRRLQALEEPRDAPKTDAGEQKGPEPRPATGGTQEAPERRFSWLRRWLGG